MTSDDPAGAIAGVVDQLLEEAGPAWPIDGGLLERHHLEVLRGDDAHHLTCRATVDGEVLCLKVYRSWSRGEALRELALLRLLAGTGLGPELCWSDDTGTRPAVATTWLAGCSLKDRPLDGRLVDAIGRAHRAVHARSAQASPNLPLAGNAGPVVLARVRAAWWRLGADLGPHVAELGATRGRFGEWLAAPGLDELVEGGERVVVRGDTNLTNYLEADGAVRLIDFEDAGWGDAEFELADMTEHFSSIGQPRGTWDRLARTTGLDPDAHRLLVARTLFVGFWLALTVERAREGRATSPPVPIETQAARLASLLDEVGG